MPDKSEEEYKTKTLIVENMRTDVVSVLDFMCDEETSLKEVLTNIVIKAGGEQFGPGYAQHIMKRYRDWEARQETPISKEPDAGHREIIEDPSL